MHRSLLAHVAAGHSQKENLATSALAYILNSSANCRDRLASLLSQASGGAVGGIARVRTEEALEAGGRPDVRLLGDDGTLRGFMEVKFWAGLTDAQPMQYLDALRGHENALLVVLAPDRRLAALREEFVARCEGTALAATRESEFLLDCGGIRLVLVAWTQLTHELVGAASGDPKVRGDVEQLRGLCSLIDEEDSFSMSREELSDVGSAMRVGMLNRLVDATVDRLFGRGLQTFGT